MTFAGDIALLFAKDFMIEVRARRTLPLVCIVSLLTIVVLALGTSPGAVSCGSVLWAAYLFGGVVCFERTMSVDRQDDALTAVLLAPIDRGAVFVAKWLTNFSVLLLVAGVVTGAAALFVGLEAAVPAWTFIRVVVLGLVGYACVGTIFSAFLGTTSRPQAGVLAAAVLPMCLPLVLVSTRLLTGVSAGPLGTLGESVLVAFDVLFFGAGWLVFDLLLEP